MTCAPESWQPEYRFSTAYGLGGYGPDSLTALAAGLRSGADPALRARYAKAYGAGHGADPQSDWPVYSCTLSRLDAASFTACQCPEG